MGDSTPRRRALPLATSLLGLLGLVLSASRGLAIEPGDSPEEAANFPAALSPEQSLAAITVRPGLKVELVAAEPLVADPVDLAFGPDGRVWVVEMADYPLGIDGQGKPGGRVRYLEDTNGDGKLDRSTLFLDGLNFPNSVLPWKQGVLIAAAPDILYAADTDGDGRADHREVLFTGLGEGNQQHRANGLRWGLDNWIYLANGDSDGVVVSTKTGAKANIRGRDLRLLPDEGRLDPQTGKTQYGRNRDDWGNWFGCNNSNPAWHFVLADHYLRRNPHLTPPRPTRALSKTPGAAAIFPTSRTLARFNFADSANRFTSACSHMIYRDTRLGAEYAGNSFVCEPVHNLVHREIVTPDGVTFRSRRAADEQTSEFFASADSWCRPTSIRLAPDGSLWVVDMYRLVIEHPQWIPAEWQAKLDIRAGDDKGRIYRISSAATDGALPRLDKLDAAGLVAALDSPNGWQRDTAQQQLRERLDPPTVALLEKAARRASRPLARLHALCTLDGPALSPELLTDALDDSHPGVRRHAIRLSEAKLDDAPQLAEKFVALVEDLDPHVQMQLAYTLGAWRDERAGELLAVLLRRHAQSPYLRAAALSSVHARNVAALLDRLFASPSETELPAELREEVLRMAVALGDEPAVARAFEISCTPAEGVYAPWQLAALSAALEQIGSRRAKLPSAVQSQLRQAFLWARETVLDDEAPQAARLAALPLLGREPEALEDDLELLVELLAPQNPPALQEAALQSLAGLEQEDLADLLVELVPTTTPRLQAKIVDVLLSRAAWTETLLAAVADGDIAPALLDATRRQRLLTHKNAAIRQQAESLLSGSASADRKAIVEQYQDVLSLTGHAQRGRQVFRSKCAACHRLENVGHEVGADLAALKDRSGQAMLIAILDPNQAVEDKYRDYALITVQGRILNGVLASETGSSITLLGQEGKEHHVLRRDIDILQSTGKSLMPEGLEKELSRQDLADLIAYIAGSQKK